MWSVRYPGTAIVTALITVCLVACSSPARLPESVQGVWTEDKTKVTWPGEPRWEQSSGLSTALKFDQQGEKGVVRVSSSYDPFKKEYTWSEPFSVKESAKNAWTLTYHGRTVSMALDDYNQLQVKGLTMRSYNQDLIKKDPEPVEAIFVKTK